MKLPVVCPEPCPAPPDARGERARGPITPGTRAQRSSQRRGAAGLLAALALTIWPGHAARAADAAPPDSALQALVADAALTLWGEGRPPPRVAVQIGQLDSRLKLTPCQRIEPYLPANTKPVGATRVGLRCREGKTLWNVYLPVTVRLWVGGLVARAALPAGTVLAAEHLMAGEVDLGSHADAALAASQPLLVGRTLAHGLAAGDALRQSDLKARQWFAAGEPVRIVAQGAGYSVQADGVALTAGIEGQPVRVRTEGGQVVSGSAIGGRQVQVDL
jgi:flagella basal body P-ring formation protein FlgA